MPLVGRGVHDIGLAGIDDHIGDASVRTFAQDVLPRRTAIGRSEQTAFSSGRPQGALSSHEHDVGIAGTDDDLADVPRLCEPRVFKRAPAVPAAIHAVPETNMASAHILARSNPDSIAAVGIDRHASNRVGRLVVKNGCERGSRVGRFHRLPDPTATYHVLGCWDQPQYRRSDPTSGRDRCHETSGLQGAPNPCDLPGTWAARQASKLPGVSRP